MVDLRRNPRTPIRLWVEIDGVLPSSVRHGDISATGLCVHLEQAIGDVGTVQWLELKSLDGTRRINVMAHVVRNVPPPKPGALHGVAVEFMPESDAAVDALHAFVRYVLLERRERGAPTQAQRAMARNLARASNPPSRVGTLTLEAGWSLNIGDNVGLVLMAPSGNKPIRLRATAANVEMKPSDGSLPRFSLEFSVFEERDGPLRRLSSTSLAAVRADDPRAAKMAEAQKRSRTAASKRPPAADSIDPFSRTVDDLLADLGADAESSTESPRFAHLSGQLVRGRLAMLATLFDMEKVSGELRVTNGDENAQIFVQDGRIVDLEPLAEGKDLRDELSRVFDWDEGRFALVLGDVDRPDKLGLGMTALLIELAHRADENAVVFDDAEVLAPESEG